MAVFGSEWVEDGWVWYFAGVFAWSGFVTSLWNVYKHLRHWHEPVFQLWIVRVLLIVPIYSLFSWITLRFDESALYLEIVRDCYEAFVIYCFLVWILNAFGGEELCGASIAHRMHMAHPWPFCCLPHIRLNSGFLRVCKLFTLQFVALKPVLGLISFILIHEHSYANVWWQSIMLTFYNLSYTVALYGLLLFYVATKQEMAAHSPVRKFLAVKAIVFMTYWQSLTVPFFFQNADKCNDFILCLEMPVFSFLHFWAFPWHEFKYAYDEVGINARVDPGTAVGLKSWLDAEAEDGTKQPMATDIVVVKDETAPKQQLATATPKGSETKSAPLIDPNSDGFYEGRRKTVILGCLVVDAKRWRDFALFCSAVWTVLNVSDIFTDAYRTFRSPNNSPQKSRDRMRSESGSQSLSDSTSRQYENVEMPSATAAVGAPVRKKVTVKSTLIDKTDDMDLRKGALSFEEIHASKSQRLRRL